MNFLKKQHSVLLFLVGMLVTFEIANAFRIVQLMKVFQNFEPVVIQYVQETPTEEITEVIPEPEPIAEPEPVTPLIDCPLDAETQQMIYDRCEELNLDFALVMGLIHTESYFNPNVISTSRDYGLMQINEFNHDWLSEELGITDYLDPAQNVKAGTYILGNLFAKYDDPKLILMSYNMGENGARKLWNQGIYTSDYAEKVLQQAEIYKEEIQERMGEK